MVNISILLILYFNSSRLVFRLVSSISTFGTLHMTSFITFLCWKMGRTINNDLKMSKQIVYNYPPLVKWGNYNLLLEGTCIDKYNKVNNIKFFKLRTICSKNQMSTWTNLTISSWLAELFWSCNNGPDDGSYFQ